MSFGFGFDFFGIMFSLVWVLFLAVFLVTIGRMILQWNKNNHSPRLTVDATVVAKRADVSRHHHNGVNDHHHYHNSTSYYVTFQVESGDRMELHMAGHEYGLLIEGDKGKLTFQGTRFLNFQRV